MNDTTSTAESLGGTDSPGQFSDLVAQYRAPAGRFNEAVDAQGQMRQTWAPLMNEIGSLGVAEIGRRVSQAHRQLELDGVAFNPHDSTGGVSRPWSLDPIPLVIRQSEWSDVAKGLDQRARLMDLILLDLLGPQTLIRERVLPPEVLFAHPRYLPAYHSLVPSPKQHLQLYAADLARSPQGDWWVTADRTRSPFGLGYILENRITTSRMLPVAFANCNVQRLAPFYITLRQTLKGLANHFRENPRIAIWSKGPKSRAYFEDAFLARYLGYTLVEGEDLAVRNNRVMLKTLGGLLPVEVLMRRVEDHQCDPAESIFGEGTSGVSGILEVIRSGNVAVSNSIGSALAESPMLLPFLPMACRHLLGEELHLPSVATWWCGQPKALQYVLDHLDQLLIRRAFRSEDEEPLTPSDMSAEDKAELIAQIKATPMMFVGQQVIERSTAPIWNGDRLDSWSLALRAFSVAKGDEYETLPGALARVSPNPDVLSHNMTSGEKSQDVWIVSDEPVPMVSLLTMDGPEAELRRGGAELPSRVADNLFWLGRNIERVEQLARLVRVSLEEVTSEDYSDAGIATLIAACVAAKQLKASKVDRSGSQIARELARGALDETVPQSLRSVVRLAYASGSKVRDRIAVDCFRVLTELREMFSGSLPDSDVAPTDLIAMLDEAITTVNAISGFASESMTRTQGWRFLDLGRRIERASQTTRLLGSLLPQEHISSDHGHALECALQICDSFMTYRGRYLANIQSAAVLDLLITDETNPRSILFQLNAIGEHVDQFPRPDTQSTLAPEQRIAITLLSQVRLADVFELARPNANGELEKLHALLETIQEQLPKLSDVISGKFLIHAGLQRHFASLSEPGR